MMFTKQWKPNMTAQDQPIVGAGQAPNHAGGYAWALSPWQLLDRFLILGTEGGTFYVGEQKLTEGNAKNLCALITNDGEKVVERVVEISESGRAPKNDPAIFALALAAALGNEATRQAAYAALPKVCRTGTHLFQFAAESSEMRGWGRGLRRAVAQWYNGRDAEQLAYQALKYQRRGGWSHRDLLRLAHPVPATVEHKGVFRWIIDGSAENTVGQIEAFERLKAERDPKVAAAIIAEAKLPREAVPTELLTERVIWEALFDEMPLTALIRNLATMTRAGLFETKANRHRVVEKLTDRSALMKARVHPLTILQAQTTYAAGQGNRGSGFWEPETVVVKALDEAFRLAFGAVDPTGQRTLIGLDVSGSMSWSFIGQSKLTAATAAAAMSLVTIGVERDATVMAFCDEFVPMKIGPKTSLREAVKRTADIAFGPTDCALPMLWATEQKRPVDLFVVYTDNETWYGKIHPAQALERYRQKMGIDAKLVVVGMTATEFTIADPRDPFMLDVVGFDSATPQAISEFAKA